MPKDTANKNFKAKKAHKDNQTKSQKELKKTIEEANKTPEKAKRRSSRSETKASNEKEIRSDRSKGRLNNARRNLSKSVEDIGKANASKLKENERQILSKSHENLSQVFIEDNLPSHRDKDNKVDDNVNTVANKVDDKAIAVARKVDNNKIDIGNKIDANGLLPPKESNEKSLNIFQSISLDQVSRENDHKHNTSSAKVIVLNQPVLDAGSVLSSIQKDIDNNSSSGDLFGDFANTKSLLFSEVKTKKRKRSRKLFTPKRAKLNRSYNQTSVGRRNSQANINGIDCQTSNSVNKSPVRGNKNPVDGNKSPVSENKTAVSGNKNPVGGNKSLVSRNKKSVRGNTSLVSGKKSSVGGNNSTFNGNQSLVSENNSQVCGNNSQVSENNSPVSVSNSLISENNSPVNRNSSQANISRNSTQSCISKNNIQPDTNGVKRRSSKPRSLNSSINKGKSDLDSINQSILNKENDTQSTKKERTPRSQKPLIKISGLFKTKSSAHKEALSKPTKRGRKRKLTENSENVNKIIEHVVGNSEEIQFNHEEEKNNRMNHIVGNEDESIDCLAQTDNKPTQWKNDSKRNEKSDSHVKKKKRKEVFDKTSSEDM